MKANLFKPCTRDWDCNPKKPNTEIKNQAQFRINAGYFNRPLVCAFEYCTGKPFLLFPTKTGQSDFQFYFCCKWQMVNIVPIQVATGLLNYVIHIINPSHPRVSIVFVNEKMKQKKADNIKAKLLFIVDHSLVPIKFRDSILLLFHTKIFFMNLFSRV